MPPATRNSPVRDGDTARAWLEALPLANASLAHSKLVTQLSMLARTELPPADRLGALEIFRETVLQLAEEQATRYRLKAVPFDAQLQAIWDDAIYLWQQFLAGLLLCVESGHEPLLVRERTLHTLASMMLEYYYAFRKVPDTLWATTYRVYREVEALDSHRTMVADPMVRHGQTTCERLFVQLLILHITNPYGMNPKQVATVRQWLSSWGSQTEVLKAWEDATQPLVVDLAGCGQPVTHETDPPPANPRYVDVVALAREWGRRLKWIKGGGDPRRAGLGSDCRPPGCEELLSQVYRLLYQGRKGRQFPRRSARSAKADVVFGFADIYHAVAGEAFHKARKSPQLTKDDLARLELFGTLPGTRPGDASEPEREVWRIRDESALGFGLERAPGLGRSVMFRQLLGIRSADSKAYALGVIRWLLFDVDHELQLGVALLPGTARAVSVDSGSSQHAPGFILPELKALREPATLVLPIAHYRYQGHVVVSQGAVSSELLLGNIRDAGADFVRAEYSFVSNDQG